MIDREKAIQEILFYSKKLGLSNDINFEKNIYDCNDKQIEEIYKIIYDWLKSIEKEIKKVNDIK